MKYEIELLEGKRLIKKKEKVKFLLRPGYTPIDAMPDLLDSQNELQLILAIFEEKKPVGLAIAAKRPFHKILELRSFHAEASHSVKGIQDLLIKTLEEKYLEEGGKVIHAVYPEEEPFLSEWEQTFIRLHWEGKRLSMIDCFFEDYRLFNPPWFQKKLPLPTGFTIFPWSELTPKDREQINVNYQQKMIPDIVYPLENESHFEPINSLGLRYDNEVVGWVLTKRLDVETIWYTSIFIEYRFHNNGAIIALLAESLRLHKEAKVKQAVFRVNVIQLPIVHWLRFVKKRLIPYATKVTRYMLSWHSLISEKNN